MTRYVVVPGDTLAAIAAALAVRGGWPALYAANRRAIGADPDVIRPGTVLVITRPAARPPSRLGPGQVRAQAGTRTRVRRRCRLEAGTSPGAARSAPAGMPSWLTTLLLAAGLLIGAAFVTEPVLAIRRRRAAARAAQAAGPAVPWPLRRWLTRARRGPATLPGTRRVSSWPTTTGWW